MIAASVCTAPEIEKPLGAWIVRPSADTMPLVTVPSSPNGLPMAIAGSPGCRSSEAPSSSGRSASPTSLGSTFSSARSADGSVPSSFATIGSPFSPKRTRNWSAPSTTCSLVTMWPSSSITKPEPEAAWPPPGNGSWPRPELAWTKTTPGETRE